MSAQEFYVWTDQQTAQNALDYINGSGWFPLYGRNAKTQEINSEAQPTVKWAKEIQQRLDGKWVFSRIPARVMDYIELPEEQRVQFMAVFKPEIEVYQEGWFPEPEEVNL